MAEEGKKGRSLYQKKGWEEGADGRRRELRRR
jgi:hypothetical protein